MADTNTKSDGCGCAPDSCAPKDTSPRRLRDIFKKSAACCCGSAAGGFLLGHASCLVTPLVIAFTGVAFAGTGAGLLAVGMSAAITAGGVALWHKIRGAKADRAEKRNVYRGAVIGFALSAVFNLTINRNHHAGHTPQQMDPRLRKDVAVCGAPANDSKPVTKIDTISKAR